MPKNKTSEYTPLAERMRPTDLNRFYGQDHLIGEGKILTRMVNSDRLVSLILWGPPGSGKTTLATILAKHFSLPCVFFSAVLSGIKEVKKVMGEAEEHKRLFGSPTILFIDEIHRFNKAQQAAFLPYVEKGVIILFGSTTENPSFEVIAPLLSRTKVLILEALSEETLIQILKDAMEDEVRGLGGNHPKIEDAALRVIVDYSNGDARRALNTLEIAAGLVSAPEEIMTSEVIEEALQKRILLYDKSGEEHYNLISALHKSLRNSNVDASLYWLGRMLAAGEDPLFIVRRLVRFASEDVGLADPAALRLTLDAKEAYEFLGSPEGELALAQVVIYLAAAPKSNRAYAALNKVMKDVEARPFEPVPLHLRNAVTGLMKSFGYGKGYQYAHDYIDATTDMETMPEKLRGRKYYIPGKLGLEKDIERRMRWWSDLKAKIKDESRRKKSGNN